jgi:hypothetical protein
VPVDDAVIGLILGAPVRKSVGLQNASGANLLEDRIINPDPIENVIAFVADQSFASDIADDQIVAVATFAFSMRERASPLY